MEAGPRGRATHPPTGGVGPRAGALWPGLQAGLKAWRQGPGSCVGGASLALGCALVRTGYGLYAEPAFPLCLPCWEGCADYWVNSQGISGNRISYSILNQA
jgi:hypothetical protein